MPRCVRIGLTQPDQNTGHPDGTGEQGGDPRPYRQQASERLPRGGKLAHAVHQEGCQGISQRGVPRHRDLPQAGRPVVRRPRLCSVLARATHQEPRRAILHSTPQPGGGVPHTSRAPQRDGKAQSARSGDRRVRFSVSRSGQNALFRETQVTECAFP